MMTMSSSVISFEAMQVNAKINQSSLFFKRPMVHLSQTKVHIFQVATFGLQQFLKS